MAALLEPVKTQGWAAILFKINILLASRAIGRTFRIIGDGFRLSITVPKHLPGDFPEL